MRIITIYTNNSNLMYGGAYRRYMELINGFILEGWEVNHISPKGFDNIHHKNLFHYGTNRYKIPIPSFIQFFIQAVPISWSVGIKKDIDAFVVFSFFDALIAIFFKIFNRNSKVVYCDRGDTVKGILINLDDKYNSQFFNRIVSFSLNKFEEFVYKRLDLIIFNSNVRREEMNQKMSLDNLNVITIYNNANPSWVIENFEKAKEESGKIRVKWRGKKIICFIGNIYIEGRDLKTLIESFKIINKELPDSVLLIVGDGPDVKRLKNIINSLNLSEKAFIEGWKENPFSYMLASDINLITALHEGCSNTILESLYYGNVTMGTDIGGIKRLLKYNELLFPHKDSKEMSRKVLILLNDENELSKAKVLINERREKFVFDWNKEMNEVIKNV